MTEHAGEVIKFPLDDDEWLEETSDQFERIGQVRGLNGMIGAIDGTLVKIIAPTEDKDSYKCRGTKDHAINAQVKYVTYDFVI